MRIRCFAYGSGAGAMEMLGGVAAEIFLGSATTQRSSGCTCAL